MGPGAKCALANSEHTQPPWVSEAVDWTKCLTAQSADWISIAIMKEKLEVLHAFAVATSTQMFPWHQLASKQISETPVKALKSVGDFLIEIWIGTALPGSHQDVGADANNASLSRDWPKTHFPQSLLRNPNSAHHSGPSVVTFSEGLTWPLPPGLI